MFQEVPLYNEFVICFSYFFIVILANVVFDWELELERVRESQLCYSDAHYL